LETGVGVSQVRCALTKGAGLARGGQPQALAGLIMGQVLEPNPMLLQSAGQALGLECTLHQWTTPSEELIRQDWMVLAGLLQVRGDLGGPLPEQAERLIAERLRVARRPGDDPIRFVDRLSFSLNAASQLGEPFAFDDVPKLLDQGSRRRAVPAAAEPMLSEDELEELPHLRAWRALRLAEEGDTKGMLHNYARWRDQTLVKPWPERFAVARALVTNGLQMCDRHLAYRSQMTKLLGSRRAGSEHDELEQRLTAPLAGTNQLVAGLVTAARQVLDRPLEAATTLDAIVLFFPLALRIDLLRSSVETPTFGRTHALVEDLHRFLAQAPSHGRARAVAAVWGEACRESCWPELVRSAVHLGSEALHADLRAQLEQLGLFHQNCPSGPERLIAR
jgi:hypothetical protein